MLHGMLPFAEVIVDLLAIAYFQRKRNNKKKSFFITKGASTFLAESLLIGLTSIIVLGIAAEWLAWWLRLPSILLLLIFGLLAGPISGFLKPDVMFGSLISPIVSLAVAIILLKAA